LSRTTIETTVVEAQSDTKVIKKDNIVLGISDLKQQQQRKLSAAKSAAATATKNNSVDKKEASDAGQSVVVTINPINTIKVNNCEIINRRPRSVTAAIFAQSTGLNPKASNSTTAADAAAEISSTKQSTGTPAKVFRPTQQANAGQSVTSKIFAPRTKDMNKGYLMFSEDDTGLTSE
jgi:hypothetical protein